jgi:hypothetical protein
MLSILDSSVRHTGAWAKVRWDDEISQKPECKGKEKVIKDGEKEESQAGSALSAIPFPCKNVLKA